jgi:hypothetical protein
VIKNDKVIFGLVRIFLAVVFVLTLGGLGLVEIVSLNQMRKTGKAITVGMVNNGLNSKKNVLLGNGQVTDVGKVDEAVVADDARPLILKRYLEKYKSPLAEYSDLIYSLSKQYGYEYYWIPAIGQQESNLCKAIPADSHNCWGYGITSKGTLKFDSYELAIKSYAEYLKREYFDKGYKTADEIMKKYCPLSNGSWAFGVNHFIAEMESGNF